MPIVWQRIQSSLDCIGGDVKAGELVGRNRASLLEHDERLIDKYRLGPLHIQAGILNKTRLPPVAIVMHYELRKFFAARECEKVVVLHKFVF